MWLAKRIDTSQVGAQEYYKVPAMEADGVTENCGPENSCCMPPAGFDNEIKWGCYTWDGTPNNDVKKANCIMGSGSSSRKIKILCGNKVGSTPAGFATYKNNNPFSGRYEGST